MYIYITFAVLPLMAHVVSCESTQEPPKDTKQVKATLRTLTVEASTSEVPSNTLNHGSLWDKTPTSHFSNQPEVWGENLKRYEMLLKGPHSLTKIAKTLSLGFDPSFNKDYFEPFERRLRPVTLVAFRKKGYAIRQIIKKFSGSNEVAEQQSPYNEVSNFWQNAELEE